METYKLTNETIDLISEKVTEMYKSLGGSKKDTLRARLLLEEALLKYKSRFGEDIDVYFRTYRIFSQTRFCVRLRAPSFDPFTLEENPMAFMIQSILTSFENGMPSWKYHNLENEVTFTFQRKKKIGSLTKIGASIVLSLLLGFISRMIFPASGLTAFVNNYINPLSDAYAGLFCVMAVILTLVGTTLSIVHVGDIASAGAMGGRILKRFYLMTSIFVIAFTLPLVAVFGLSEGGSINVAAKSIYDILIGFIPTNLVRPFLDFNSIHIMIIGAMFGFSILSMGTKGENVTNLFEECNLVAVFTNNFINRFISIYVGFKVFTIVTTSEFSQLANAGKMVIAVLVSSIIILIVYTFYACIKSKIPLSKYIKTLMPPFMISLSSANFGAAYSSMFDAIIASDAGDDNSTLACNLGSVVFQPSCTVAVVISSLFMANAYGVKISAVWVFTAIVLAIVLIASVPNIPGASVSVFTLMFAQLGLPNEALSLMIAIYAVLQFPVVAVDIWCLISECVCMNAIDKKKAQKAEAKATK